MALALELLKSRLQGCLELDIHFIESVIRLVILLLITSIHRGE